MKYGTGRKVTDERGNGQMSDKETRQGPVISKVREESDDISPLDAIDFTTKCYWTDIKLVVEGKELYVPKSHLAMLSPVLRVMFKSDFKEKDIDVIPLPGKKYEDVLTFLRCTHPGALQKVTIDVVPIVLPIAHEYQMKWLIDVCAEIMREKFDASYFPKANSYIESSDIVRFCNMAILAETYGLNYVLEIFIDRFSAIWYGYYKALPEFNNLSLETRLKIVCRRLDSKDKNQYQ